MKYVVAIAVAAMLLIGAASWIDARSERNWLEFSAQHHCSMAPHQSLLEQTTWQCDGFQVKH